MKRAILTAVLLLAASLACTKATPTPPVPGPLGSFPLPTGAPTSTPKLPELAISPEPDTVTLTGDWNCRAAPSITAEIIVTLQDGQTVELTGRTESGWTEIEYGDEVCWLAGWK